MAWTRTIGVYLLLLVKAGKNKQARISLHSPFQPLFVMDDFVNVRQSNIHFLRQLIHVFNADRTQWTTGSFEY